MRPRTVRLLTLLAVAAAIAAYHFTRDAGPPDWERPLKVVIYPENADGSEQVRAHIQALDSDRFRAVENYMSKQAGRYDLAIERPFILELADPITGAPTAPDYRSFRAYLQWGLRLRLWYWTFDDQGRAPDITLIARYRRAEDGGDDGDDNGGGNRGRLHSLGIPEMNLAVANLVAGESSQGLNDVVLAHELLHTVGASDLYDPATGLPEYPEGYADPDRRPRHPQTMAELMAGRIPVAPGRAEQAERLDRTIVGHETATDIGWKRR